MKHLTITRTISGIFIFLFFIGGCVSTSDKNSNSLINTLGLPTEKLPTYQKGTKYVYSDGSWEKVLLQNDDNILWIDNRGNKSSRPIDFVYKKSEWETKKRSGSRIFKPVTYRFGQQRKTLWPLQKGNKFRYLEQGKWQKKGENVRKYEVFWFCQVNDTEEISVPAGTFNTWQIECKKYSNEFSAVTSLPWERKTFYYAPAINHIVALYREFPRQKDIKSPRRKELVAVMPALKGIEMRQESLSALQQQFQNTLERNASGQQSLWHDHQSKDFFAIKPIATFRKEGLPCRQYEQEFVLNGTKSNYFGIACRNSNGKWKVPRF